MSLDPKSPETIFGEAIAIESRDDRAAFLDRACQHDPDLRRELEKLVMDHFRAGDFLEKPAAKMEATLDQPVTEKPGAVIGPYKLLQQIGEGGMGVVYMAEQSEPVARRVALKIIKPGMDTRQVIARFEAERQALAMMDHPNIARVFDAGTTGGNPKYEARNPKQGGNPRSESRNPKQIQSTKSKSQNLGDQEVSDIPDSNLGFVSDFGFRASDLDIVSDFGFRHSDFSPGRPYFLMELVKGVPITQYCDEHHLTPRQRLELFVPVCHAVQHAHQKGIIHRDIKPSNVLVAEYDDRPVPKIIDFGVAKAIDQRLTERTMFTALGQLVGTIDYMSPEQATLNQLDVDTRSDIYSLGVLLYELLTGETPLNRQRLRSSPFDEMLRIIREEEPPRPSARISTLGVPPLSRHGRGTGTEGGVQETAVPSSALTIAANRKTEPAKLSRLLRGDLDWIVMKALEKDRARRYEAANDFAADIERYLADEPVEARPPSLLDRPAKWARRHRALVCSAVACAMVVAAVLVGSTILLFAAYEGEKREHDAAVASAAEAQENYEVARQAVQQMLTRVADEQLARIPEMKEVRRRLLEDAVAFYAQLVKLNPRDPRAYFERGQVYDLLRKYEKVRADYEKAIELEPDNAEFHQALTRFCSRCPDVAFRDLKCASLHANWALRLAPQQSEYHYDMAIVYQDLGEKDKAVAEMRRAAELSDNEAGRTFLESAVCAMAGDVRGALEWEKKAAALAPDNGWHHHNLATWYLKLGEYENAITAATRSIALFRNVRTESADNTAFYPYDARGDAHAALKMYREALADYDKSAELGPFRSYTYKRRALVHFHLKNYDKALADIAKAIELRPDDFSNLTWIPLQLAAKCPDEKFRKGLAHLADKTIELTKPSSGAWEARSQVYAALSEVAFNDAIMRGAWEASRQVYAALGRSEELIARLKKLAGESPDKPELRKQLATAYFARGDKPFHEGDLEKAFPDLDRAIQYNPECSEAYDHRGNVFLARGDFDKAIADYDRAIRFGPAYPTMSYPNRAAAYLGKGEFSKADADLTKAIEFAPDHAKMRFDRALSRWSAGRADEYRKDCAEMLQRFAQTDNVGTAYWTAWICTLAPSAAADWSKPIVLAEKAVKGDPKNAPYVMSLGAVLFRAGRLDDAIRRLEEADRLVPNPSEKRDTYSACAWFFLAMAHQRLRHADQAKMWFAKAADWTDNALRGSGPAKSSPLAWDHRMTLNLLRAEAAEVLGIDKNVKKPPAEKERKKAP